MSSTQVVPEHHPQDVQETASSETAKEEKPPSVASNVTVESCESRGKPAPSNEDSESLESTKRRVNWKLLESLTCPICATAPRGDDDICLGVATCCNKIICKACFDRGEMQGMSCPWCVAESDLRQTKGPRKFLIQDMTAANILDIEHQCPLCATTTTLEMLAPHIWEFHGNSPGFAPRDKSNSFEQMALRLREGGWQVTSPEVAAGATAMAMAKPPKRHLEALAEMQDAGNQRRRLGDEEFGRPPRSHRHTVIESPSASRFYGGRSSRSPQPSLAELQQRADTAAEALNRRVNTVTPANTPMESGTYPTNLDRKFYLFLCKM